MISAGSVDDTCRICTSNVSCGSGEVLSGGEYHIIYIGAVLCNVSCDSGEVLNGGEYHTVYIGALLCSCSACSGSLVSPAGKTLVMLHAIVTMTMATTVILVQITSSMNSIFYLAATIINIHLAYLIVICWSSKSLV